MLLRPPTALTGLSWLPELGLGPAACRPGDTISESGRPAGPGGQWLSFGGRGAVAAVSCEAETALGRPTFPSGRPAGSSSSRTPPPGGIPGGESQAPRVPLSGDPLSPGARGAPSFKRGVAGLRRRQGALLDKARPRAPAPPGADPAPGRLPTCGAPSGRRPGSFPRPGGGPPPPPPGLPCCAPASSRDCSALRPRVPAGTRCRQGPGPGPGRASRHARYLVTVSTCVSAITCEVARLLTCSSAAFSADVSLRPLAQFLIRWFVFLSLSFKSSLYILSNSLHHICKHFLQVSGFSSHSLDAVFTEQEGFFPFLAASARTPSETLKTGGAGHPCLAPAPGAMLAAGFCSCPLSGYGSVLCSQSPEGRQHDGCWIWSDALYAAVDMIV